MLGAPVSRLIWDLTKEFFILVSIANFIALPLIYFGWSKIMQTGILFIKNITMDIFVYAIIISLISTLIAVISQTLKTTMANPADTLRYE